MLKKGRRPWRYQDDRHRALWIPLTVSLSDSTHGEINAFELVTCRIRDSDGAEGVGYTYTVGRNGGAIAERSGERFPN